LALRTQPTAAARPPRGGGEPRVMVQVVVNEGDDLERVLRRFKRQVQKAGIFTDLKRKKHYEKPSEMRKRKRNAARRRSRRTRQRR
jgi:small subunit ribosomal protein S21